mgnify:CR=1 FL=1
MENNNTSLQQQLLEAGVHFGNLKKKWNPKMLPYIFAEKKGIHIIDLNKTVECMQETAAVMKQIARSGKKILFVGTKKQAKDIVTESAQKVGMPFVTERWLGGMLTNFNTVRKSVKKMQSIEKMLNDGSFDNITKKERLTLSRDKDKIAGWYCATGARASCFVHSRYWPRAYCISRSKTSWYCHIWRSGYQLRP